MAADLRLACATVLAGTDERVGVPLKLLVARIFVDDEVAWTVVLAAGALHIRLRLQKP